MSSTVSGSATAAGTEVPVQVAVRIKPISSGHRCFQPIPGVSGGIHEIDTAGKAVPKHSFAFDDVFDVDSTNKHVFDRVAKDIVRSVVTGYHGAIFAYGQTASGKTYTMQGDKASPGIFGQAIEEIFQAISESNNRAFLIRVSYLEIYNEKVHDLLATDSDKEAKIVLNPKNNNEVRVEATERVISNANEIVEALVTGEKKRAVSATAMNQRSSRSHAIFRITVESRPIASEADKADARASTEDFGHVVSGTLNLIDLAGSESVRRTNAQGDRLREAGAINTSLVTLSRCISMIADISSAGPSTKDTKMVIPFRDSKLTWVLKNALEGNTRIAIICCLTPEDKYLGESRSTLSFAQQAKRMKLTCKVNEVEDEDATLKNLTREMSRLKAELEMYKAREAALRTTVVPLSSNPASAAALVAAGDRQVGEATSKAASDDKIAEMEKMIEKYREQIFVGGAQCSAPTTSKIDTAAFDELLRIRQRMESTARQAAMGRSKRHRETWCPTASTAGGLSADFLSGLKAASRLPRPPTGPLPSAAEGNEDAGSIISDGTFDDDRASMMLEDDVEAKPPTKVRRSSGDASVHDAFVRIRAEEEEGAAVEAAPVSFEALPPQQDLKQLQAMLASKQMEADDLRAQVNSTQDQLDKCRDAMAEYEQLATTAMERESSLEARVAQLEAMLVTEKSAVAAVSQEFEAFKASSSASASQLSLENEQLQRDVYAAQQESHMFANKLNEVVLQLSDRTAETVALQAQMAAVKELYEQQLSKLQALLAQKDVQLSESSVALQASQNNVETVNRISEETRAQLQELRDQLKIHMDEIEQLKVENVAAVMQHEAAMAEVLGRESAALDRAAEAEKQAEHYKCLHQQTQHSLTAAEEQLRVLTSSEQDRDLTVAALSEQVSAARQATAQMELLLATEKADHENTIELLKSRDAKMLDLEKKVADVEKKLAESVAKCSKAKAQLTSMEVDFETVEQERDELERQLECLRKLSLQTLHVFEPETIDEELANIQELETEVTLTVTNARLTIDSLEAEKKDALQTIEGMKVQLAEALASSNDLTQMLVGSKYTISSLTEQLNDAQAKLAAATSDMVSTQEATKQESAAVAAKAAELEQSLIAYDAYLLHVADNMTSLASGQALSCPLNRPACNHLMATLHAHFEERVREFSSVERLVQDKEAQIQALSTQMQTIVAELTAQLACKGTTVDSLLSVIAQVSTINFEAEVDEIADVLSSVERSVCTLKGNVSEEAEKQAMSVCGWLSDVYTAFTVMKQDAQTIKELTDTVETLQNEVAALQEANHVAEQRAQELQARNEDAMKKNGQLDAMCIDLAREVEAFKSMSGSTNDLASQLLQANETIGALQSRDERKQRQLDELQERKAALETELSNVQTTLQTLQEEQHTTAVAMAQLQQRCESLQAERDELQEVSQRFEAHKLQLSEAEMEKEKAIAAEAMMARQIVDKEVQLTMLMEELGKRGTELHAAQQSLTSLQAAYAKQTTELADMTAFAQQATAEVERSRKLLQESKAEAADIQIRLNIFMEELGAKDSQLAVEQRRTVALQSMIDQLNETVQTLQAQLTQQDAERQALQAEKAACLRQMEALRTRSNELQERITTFEKERRGIAEALADADKEFEEQRRVFQQAKEAEINRLRNKLAQSEEQVMQLNEQITECNELLLDVKQDSASQGMELQKARDELLELTAREQHWQHEFQTCSEKLAVTTRELHAANAQIEEQLIRIKEQHDRIEDLDKKKITAAMVKQMSKTKEEYEKSKQQAKQLREEVAALTERLRVLESSHTSTATHSDDLHRQMRTMQMEHAAAMAEAVTMRMKIEGQLDDALTALQDTRQALQATQEDQARAQAAAAQLQEELLAVKTENLRLKDELLALHADVVVDAPADCENVVSRVRAAFVNLKEQHAHLVEEKTALQEQSNALRDSVAAERAKWAEEMHMLQNQLVETERLVDELDAQRRELADECAISSERISEFEQNVEALELQLQNVHKQRLEMEQNYERAVKQCDIIRQDSQRQITFLEKENLQLMAEIRSVRSAVGATGRASMAPGRTSRISVMRPSGTGRTSVYEGGAAARQRQPLGAVPASASTSNVDPDLLAVFTTASNATTSTETAAPPKMMGTGEENTLTQSKVLMASSSSVSADAMVFPGSAPAATETPGECAQQ